MSIFLPVVTAMQAVKGVSSANPLVKSERVDEVVECWLHAADRNISPINLVAKALDAKPRWRMQVSNITNNPPLFKDEGAKVKIEDDAAEAMKNHQIFGFR